MLSADICLCATCVPGAHKGQKRAPDPLDLELDVAVSHNVGPKDRSTLNAMPSLQASPTLALCISDPPRTYLSARSLAGVHHCITYISDFSLIAVTKIAEEYKI